MIPLVRPKLPNWDDIGQEINLANSIGKLSNFGPCYWRLVEALADITHRYDVPVTSGTAAIQVAAQAMFKRGSRILLPDYTHVGTLQALVTAGMIPILAPASKTQWTLNAALLGINKEDYDGFVVVSPFGFRVDFGLYDQISTDLGKPVVYDLAGGFGMKILTKNPVCFSMHATKNFPIGEGGIASFSTINQADVAFKLSCFDQNKDRSISSPYGSNLKLDEVRCAIAYTVLAKYSLVLQRAERKRYLIDLYQKEMPNLCIAHDLHHGNSAPSLCVVAGLPASRIEEKQNELGFEVKQYYPLLSSMEGLGEVPRIGTSSPFFRTCAALPSDVTDEEAKKICKALIAESRGPRARD